MLNKKILFFSSILTLVLVFIACSSQEYTTAKLAIQQSDFKKAEEWLPKAMAVEPDNPEIPIVMAVEVNARKSEWKKMNEMFEKAMAINPEKEIEVQAKFRTVKETVSNYRSYYWAKEFNLGVEQFKKIQDDPDNKLEYLDLAITHFENAALIDTMDANTFITLAKSYLDKGDKDAAKNAALTAVERNPENFDANYKAGQILGSAGTSSKDILPYYEKATKIEPSNSMALKDLAGMYYDLDQKEKSIEVFENAIANEEDKIVKANLYFNLGVIYNQIQNYEEAEKAFDEAFFLNEDDYEAAMGMVVSYEGLGDKYLNGECQVNGVNNGMSFTDCHADDQVGPGTEDIDEGNTIWFEKDLNEAYRWYRKAEKKIKSVMVNDMDNRDKYKKTLEIIRYKKDMAEGF